MLEPILEAARRRAADRRRRLPEWQAAVGTMPPARDFAEALSRSGLSVIAEIKRRSPSAGVLQADLDPVARAGAYVAGGAAAISVLTEPDFFDGSLADLAAVRASVDVPVLRKDFILEPSQIWEARAHEADAVLLIVAALTDDELSRLLTVASSVGVAALVEVHTEVEAKRALAAGAQIVGVNNRDLSTFTTDLATAETIAGLLDDVPLRVAESGVSSPDGAARMAAAGYHAVLVGEALVRSLDPARLVSDLRTAAAAGGPS